jgi:hypothetical protein
MNGSHRSAVALSVAVLLSLASSLRAGGGLLFGDANRGFSGGEVPCVALADIDQDGLVDLLYAIEGPGFSWLQAVQGTGNGAFMEGAGDSFGSAGDTPASLVTADFDGDGRLDAALVDRSPGAGPDLRLWMDDDQQGWPPFRPDVEPQAYDLGSGSPTCVATGDVDGDADVDLVVGVGDSFLVLLNDGTGSFVQLPGGSFNGGEVTSLAIADLDGDGLGDVVATKSNRTRRFLSLGDGSFDPGLIVAQDGSFTDDGLRVADIDLDGRADILLASTLLGTSWLKGDGSGGFAAPVTLSAASASRLLVDDVDADAIPDLAVLEVVGLSGADGLLRTLAGHGDGSFTTLPGIELRTPGDLSCGDVNGDGRRDVVVGVDALHGVAVVENLGTGRWADAVDLPCADAASAQDPTPPALADMDGDGDLDVVVGVFREPRVFSNPGPSGAWPAPLALTKAVPGARLGRMLAADLDGALGPDLVGVSGTTAGVHVWLNTGPSSYAAPVMIPLAGDALDAALSDLDLDGDLDLVVAHVPEVSVLFNDGAGSLGEPIGLPWTADRLAVADFDGDSIPDLAMIEQVPPPAPSILRVVQGQGDGSFVVRFVHPFEFPVVWTSVRAGDQDLDGSLDLLMGGPYAVSQLSNDGDFSFGAPVSWNSSFSNAEPRVAELDGLPGPEIACQWWGVSVLHSSGGAYGDHSMYGARGPLAGFELADMDGDGDLDAVMTVAAGVDSLLTVMPGRTSDPWQGLNGGLAGTHGVPELSGTGMLQLGSPMGLALVRARESAPAALVIGLQAANLPFKGGTMVPSPQLLVSGLLVHADGSLHLGSTWPALPAGLKVVLQFWIVDPEGPVGLAASNALAAVSH